MSDDPHSWESFGSPLSKDGNLYPGWIPCTACRQSLKYHIDLKCPFDSTTFRPGQDTVDMILGELRLAEEKLRTPDDWDVITNPGGVLRTRTLEGSIRRYFLAYEVVVDTLLGKLNIE